MIRLIDATTLALTKLRTRKIRTTVTIIISALVFAILIAALSLSQGVFKSLSDFSHEGLNDRYLVRASAVGGLEPGMFKDPELVARAKQLYAEKIAEKAAYAKQLGITYDPKSETPPYNSHDGDPKNERILPNNPIGTQVLLEYYAAHPKAGLQELKAAAASYNPIDFIKSTYFPSTLNLMTQGKEVYPDPTGERQVNQSKDAVFGNDLQFVDSGLAKPFMLPSVTWSPENGRIPVIVTQSGAESLLNLKKLSKDATPQEQLDRISTVRRDVATAQFSACYRNDVSSAQINLAVMLPYDIKKNAANTSYRQPSVQYQVPADNTCAAAVVTKDTRSASEKKYTANQMQFDEKFGATVRPQQEKLEFQVVGIMPDPFGYQEMSTLDGLVEGVIGASSLYITTIPQNLYDQLSNENKHSDILAKHTGFDLWVSGGDPTIYTVEFTNASDARRFMDEKSCNENTTAKCAKKGTLFALDATGSNSIALNDLQDKVMGILKIAALVSIGVAIVIMSGMIGRMVADGRRETAVFRAIGFKRLDIAAVYTVYTFILSVYVAILALVLGLAAAFVVDSYYWSMLTLKAKLAFGASDPTREFHLFSLDSPWIWLVGVLIILLGFISMTIPLLRNDRRNPIKDMRDE